MDACARCAAENASLTQMSPSLASSATKAGSFFSSSLWKRVFSRQRTSPSFIAATALAAASPMQSSAKATGFLMTFDSASATGFSESLASRPFGRPKCASRMTLPPLSEISVMVGAMRSSRVASETRPLSMGTLRSTRSSTRLAFTSTSSRVRNLFMHRFPRHPGAKLEPGSTFRVCVLRTIAGRRSTWMPGTRPGMTTNEFLTAACPSRRRCRPCDWRNPIHCRTRTSRAPACRSAPWSGPRGTSRSGDRG